MSETRYAAAINWTGLAAFLGRRGEDVRFLKLSREEERTEEPCSVVGGRPEDAQLSPGGGKR